MAWTKEKQVVYMKDYYRNNKEKWNRDHKNWYESYGRRYQLKQKFGITPEQYDALYEKQGGACAICKRKRGNGKKNGAIKRLAVDHNHETGKVRGLLCEGCNRSLGMVRDDIVVLRAMIDYLTDNGG